MCSQRVDVCMAGELNPRRVEVEHLVERHRQNGHELERLWAELQELKQRITELASPTPASEDVSIAPPAQDCEE